jgi:hypothetical protein
MRLTAGDEDSLARAVRTVADRPDSTRAADAHAAHEWVASNRSLRGTAKRVVDIYERALSR